MYLYLLSILGLVCSSCQKKEMRPGKNYAQLQLTIAQEPSTLDPRKGGDITSSTMQFLLFEGLTQLNPYSTVSLALAEKIVISEDKKTYTFHLRKTHWSNGVPLTAFDFVQTWKDMLHPHFPCPNAHLLYPIKNAEAAKKGLVPERQIGIRAIDYQTLEVYLEEPTPFFLEMLSFCVYFPIYQNVATRIARWSECTGADFICNGPYRLVQWRHNHEIILEKNPYYWNKEHVNLDRITIAINSDMPFSKTFEKDELDILGLPFAGILSDAVPTLRDKGLIKTTVLPTSTICCFNQNCFPFQNANIRKAFSYAIKRKEMLQQTSYVEPLNQGNLPPFFKDGEIETARIFFRKGLKELHLKEEDLDNMIVLLYPYTGVYPKIAETLRIQWKKALGINVKLSACDYKTFITKIAKREYQLTQCLWINQYPDTSSF